MLKQPLLRWVVLIGVLYLILPGLKAQSVPAEAPRTWIPAGQHASFQNFVQTGQGKVYFDRIKSDFDAFWTDFMVPDQPDKYGDPDPRKRTADKVVLWRAAQDLCNQIATVAEAATLIWIATGEERYLDQAQEILLDVSAWDPDGVANIYYNDEAHFRLWRKLPGIYDQLRETFTEEERAFILKAFRERGKRSVAWIRDSNIEEVQRNSIEVSPSSHPVRFIAMTGVSGLALWDDIPEAKSWFEFARDWYREKFTPWGGENGGWAEGIAYWRGVYEHAVFQDALLLIGDPGAYAAPFWQETGYFQVYFTQPYLATSFGDLSNSGKFNLDPGVWHFMRHLGRVTGNGHFISFSNLHEDPRPKPENYGLERIWRGYPTATEYLLQEFAALQKSEPEPVSLSRLPRARHFRDIGWVAFHSDLGNPEEDIHFSFKSSPYGSYSHSHGDQNAFILNAYGVNLAINSGYREYHRSHHHAYYTRETRSSNAVLVNLRGQAVQSKQARGEIIGFSHNDRLTWTAGEANEAYQILQPRVSLDQVRRDVVMVDNRFFIIRDRISGSRPFMTSWMLHAERPIAVNEETGALLITNQNVHLGIRLAALNNRLRAHTWTGFDVAVDPDYLDPVEVAKKSWMSAPNVDQFHLRMDLEEYQEDTTIFALLYPSRVAGDMAELQLEVIDEDTVKVQTGDSGDLLLHFNDHGAQLITTQSENLTYRNRDRNRIFLSPGDFLSSDRNLSRPDTDFDPESIL